MCVPRNDNVFYESTTQVLGSGASFVNTRTHKKKTKKKIFFPKTIDAICREKLGVLGRTPPFLLVKN